MPDARRLLAALPGLLVLAAAFVLLPQDAGFAAADWYAASLFVLVLGAVTAAAGYGRVRRPRGAELVALVALFALVVLSLLSIAWAVVPGDAWDGANRTLLYLLAFAVVLACPWPAPSLRLVLGLVIAGIVVLAVIALLRGDAADYLGGRLAWPASYSNATASLWLIGAFPALALSVDRGLHWSLRGLALGAATLLVATSLLSQSRGAAAGAAVTAILLVAVIPRRWPAIAALATVGVAIAAVWSRLLDVRDATSVAQLADRAAGARGSILLVALAAAVLGALAAFAGPRLLGAERPRARRAGDLALAALGVAALVGAIAGALLSPGWVDKRWDDFKSGGYTAVESGSTRFSGALGSNRYDFYRVALDEFADHPIAGTGADNFAVAYLEDRRSPEAPRYPHSLALQMLSGLGVLGAGLLLAFLGAVGWAFARRRRVPEAGVAVTAALTGGAVWLIHGMVDWLWMFPGLGVLAFALLAMAARGGAEEPTAAPAEPGLAGIRSVPSAGLALRAAAVVLTFGAAISLALPGIAARFTSAALGHEQTTPRDLDRLDQAAKFESLSAQPLLALAVLARRAGDPGRARDALAEAVQREPENWFAWLEHGMTQAGDGRREDALRSLDRAIALNPRQPVLRDVRRRVLKGVKLDPAVVEGQLSGQLSARQNPVEARQ